MKYMIHIIGAILKVFGILILILLGIMLFLLLAALFCPFLYRIKIKRDTGMPEGVVYLSWLAWLISVKAEYRDKRLEVTIRLLGIPLKHFKTVFQLFKKIIHPLVAWYRVIVPGRQKPAHSDAYEEANAEEMSDQQSNTDKMPNEKKQAAENESESKDGNAIDNELAWKTSSSENKSSAKKDTVLSDVGQESQKREKVSIWQRIKSIVLGIISIPKRIIGVFRKIYLTIREICGRIKKWKQFLTAETTKKALSFMLGKGKAVLHHVKPRKIKGSLKFGFDDPSMTGQILAGFSVLYPVYKQKLTIIPMFNEQVLECDLDIRGHIFGCVILKAAWNIYRNKNVKRTIRRFQHKEA